MPAAERLGWHRWPCRGLAAVCAHITSRNLDLDKDQTRAAPLGCSAPIFPSPSFPAGHSQAPQDHVRPAAHVSETATSLYRACPASNPDGSGLEGHLLAELCQLQSSWAVTGRLSLALDHQPVCALQCCLSAPRHLTQMGMGQGLTSEMWCASCRAPEPSQGAPSPARGHLPGTAATPAAGLRSASPAAELLLLLLAVQHQGKGPASLQTVKLVRPTIDSFEQFWRCSGIDPDIGSEQGAVSPRP